MSPVSHTQLGFSSTFWLNVYLRFLQLMLVCYSGHNATQSSVYSSSPHAHTHTHPCTHALPAHAHTHTLFSLSSISLSCRQTLEVCEVSPTSESVNNIHFMNFLILAPHKWYADTLLPHRSFIQQREEEYFNMLLSVTSLTLILLLMCD